MQGMICIYRTDNPMKADLICAHLKSIGIFTSIRSHDASGMMPHLRSIQPLEIWIPKERFELAKEILENDTERNDKTDSHHDDQGK